MYIYTCYTLYTLQDSIYSRRWRLLLLEGRLVRSFYRTWGSEASGEIIKGDRDEFAASAKVAAAVT